MNYLGPYIWLDPPDPDLDEFTYGEHGYRGRRLLKNVKKGDYIFFHTKTHRQKVISAYFVVDRIMRTMDVQDDPHLSLKYHAPHLDHEDPDENDVIVFGDPIESRKLRRPLPFDRRLAKRLDLAVKFRKDRTDTQSIGSACREWRELSQEQVQLLLDEIEDWEKDIITDDTLLSTDEISQFLERDLENYLTKNPHILGKRLKVSRRQMDTPKGRLDLLLEDRRGNLVVAELKLDLIGRDAIQQLKRYMSFVGHERRRRVRGIIVCRGVLPAFEEDLSELEDISILVYGWKMGIQEW